MIFFEHVGSLSSLCSMGGSLEGEKSCPFTAIAIVSRTAARQESKPIGSYFGGQVTRFSFARSDARLAHAALPRFSTSG